MNYDPNLVTCGRMATQTVKLVFGVWEYRKEVTVKVDGNCKGSTVILAAVGRAYDELPYETHGRYDYAQITLDDQKGGEPLICEDDESKGEDWLADMLISAEIIDIKPEEGEA